MANTAIALFAVFGEGGLAWSVLQKKDINLKEVRNLFWINACVGGLLAAVTFLTAPAISRFYSEPLLTPVLRALSISFLLSGITTAALAWMRRQLRAKELALIDLTALIISGSVAIILAFNGFGYWSLVTMILLRTAMRAGAILIVAREMLGHYEPKTSVKSLLNFGVWIQLSAIISYSYKNIDSIAIGKFWGSEALALYAKALFLVNLPATLTAGALGTIAIPLLSRHQSDLDLYQEIYLRLVKIIITLALPVSLFLVVFPHQSVAFLYGSSWASSADILTAFAPACLAMPIYATVSWIFISKGKGRLLATWSFASAVSYGVAVTLAIDKGPAAVATAYSIVIVVLSLVSLAFALKMASISISRLAIEIISATIPIGISLALVKIISNFTQITDAWLFVMIYAPMLVLMIIGMLLANDKGTLLEQFSIPNKQSGDHPK